MAILTIEQRLAKVEAAKMALYCKQCGMEKVKNLCVICTRPKGKFTEAIAKKVIECGRKGYSEAQTRVQLKISITQWEVWKEDNPTMILEDGTLADGEDGREVITFTEVFRAYKDLQSSYFDTIGMDNFNNRHFNSRTYELFRMNMHGWNKKTDAKQQHSGNVSLAQLTEEAEKES